MKMITLISFKIISVINTITMNMTITMTIIIINAITIIAIAIAIATTLSWSPASLGSFLGDVGWPAFAGRHQLASLAGGWPSPDGFSWLASASRPRPADSRLTIYRLV